MLVVELHSTGDGLGQGEPAGLSHDLAQLIPDRLRHILGHQGLAGLYFRERIGHDDLDLMRI